MFTQPLLEQAARLLDSCRAKGLKIATVESCTGGLVTALLTEIAGSSDVVERGFVTYTNISKMQAVGVPETVIAAHGAVSAQTATAMAEGGLRHSEADLCIALTGVAGPAGGSAEKPVGLVHIALATRTGQARHERYLFTQPTRSGIRLAAVAKALELLQDAAN